MNILRIVIATVVAVVWAVVYLATVFNPNVSAPPELSGVMLAVVTWLFGRAFREGFIKEKARNAARDLLDDGKDDKDKGVTEDAKPK